MQRIPEEQLMTGKQQVNDYVAAIRDLELIAPTHQTFIRRVAKTLPPNAKLVDLGCGSADPLLLLLQIRQDLTAIGIDLSDNMLEAAETQSKALNLSSRVEFLKQDMTTLDSIDDASMDAVISTLSLHHLPTEALLHQAMRCVKRVLKPNGTVFFSDFARLPNTKWVDFFTKLDRKVQPPFYEQDFHNSMKAAWSAHEFAQACRLVGLPIKQQVTAYLPFLQIAYSKPANTPDHHHAHPHHHHATYNDTSRRLPMPKFKHFHAKQKAIFLNTWLKLGKVTDLQPLQIQEQAPCAKAA